MSLTFWHHHYGISVPSLDAAIAWWERTLSFTLLRRYEIASIPAEVAVMGNGSCHVELFESPHAKAPSEQRSIPNEDIHTWGNKHPSFAIENARDFAAELAARGADIVWVKEFPFGANIFIRDQAGNLIEFVQNSRPELTFSTL
ncbi:VOC family protein [Novosphingobium profundi]|uniref:VOC family protein n=1 Tax=Novosphingobium profundi TaxID=1774954 RepID=UPI001BD9FFE5|nr:VOC family protein [Novosphingobium profundi]MBT0670471.1 VOC family protein [Novosphingobium profundi]